MPKIPKLALSGLNVKEEYEYDGVPTVSEVEDLIMPIAPQPKLAHTIDENYETRIFKPIPSTKEKDLYAAKQHQQLRNHKWAAPL